MNDEATAASAQNGPLAWINRQLRITAIRDMFSLVEVRRVELVGLVSLAVVYALTEGVSLSVLLPVLQYAEDGTTSTGVWIQQFAERLGVPVNLVTLLVIAFIPVMLRQVTFYLNAWFSAVVSNRITVRMRVDAYTSLMEADPDFFNTRPQGELAGMLLNQTTVAGQAILQVMWGLSCALQILIYVAILAYLSVPLTVLAMVAGLLVSGLLRTNMIRTREYGARVTEITQRTYGAIIERIALSRLVKMRAEEEAETENVRSLSEDAAVAGVGIARLTATVEVTADPLLMLSAFATLYIGVSVLNMQLAELSMLLFVLTRLNGRVKDFNRIRQGVSGSVSGMHLVREVTAQAKAANTITGGTVAFPGLSESIVLTDVTFKYPGSLEPTLDRVSARIESGSFTAIVGRSGAGKSTFVELLPRLRDVTSGSVEYDGMDIRDFELSGLRRGIGYLTQEPMLFNDTLRMNLLYGVRHSVTEADLARALDQAHATFVDDLPAGLDTRLGDRGVRFSGGERQRIALARVLLEKPTLLILDEPTSALDSESELFIQQALSELHGSTTIVVIAHRLATVVAADQLLVMENGRIVQRGVHDDLVAAEGPYRHLFESQLLKV